MSMLESLVFDSKKVYTKKAAYASDVILESYVPPAEEHSSEQTA